MLKDLAPILIASPVRRSGTTLLQRLLTSADNCLIYGETCANDLNFFMSVLSNKELMLNSSKQWRDNQLKGVLDGNVNDWIPDLMPEIDGYLEAVSNSAETILKHYEDFAAKQGRSLWGMKLPEWNPSFLAQVKNRLPNAKIIYLTRDLKDCLKSAKKIGMVQSLDEMNQFCHTWKQYKDYAFEHLNGSQALQLSFDELVKPNVIETLQEFSGAASIDAQVLQHKINNYTNSETGTNYMDPDELTVEELALIQKYLNGV